MCYKLLTEFVIKEISNPNSNQGNRNAVIIKHQDDSIIFNAIIQQSPCKACQDEIIIYPTNDSFSEHISNPMVCRMPIGSTIEMLKDGDLITKIL